MISYAEGNYMDKLDKDFDYYNYEDIGRTIGKLVTEKQRAYGDSFGKAHEILKVLFPEGVRPDQYQDMLTLVRIIDKMFRIATAKDAFGECPYSDIAGYGILGSSIKRG